MAVPGSIQLTHGHEFDFGTTQYHGLGTMAYSSDGRIFRYVLAGASALVPGNMIQAPAQVANHLALTPVAAAIGDVAIVAALGATLSTVNQYAEGWAIISLTPGNGYIYPISGHAAIASSGTGTFNLLRSNPVQVALTTSSRVDLQANPCSGVIQTPVTTLTGACVGCAISAIPAAQYGWIQVHGPAPVLVAGTPGVGLAVVVPGTAAGCVVIDGAAAATPVVGVMMSTGVDAKNNAVFLTIA